MSNKLDRWLFDYRERKRTRPRSRMPLEEHNWNLHDGDNETIYEFYLSMPKRRGLCDLCPVKNEKVFRPIPVVLQSFGLRSLCVHCVNVITLFVEGKWKLCWLCSPFEDLQWAILDYFYARFNWYFHFSDFIDRGPFQIKHKGEPEPEIIRERQPIKPLHLEIRRKIDVTYDL